MAVSVKALATKFYFSIVFRNQFSKILVIENSPLVMKRKFCLLEKHLFDDNTIQFVKSIIFDFAREIMETLFQL